MIFRQIFISEVLVAVLFAIYLDRVVCQPSGYSYKDPSPQQQPVQPQLPKVKDLLEKALPLAQAAENSNQVHSNVVAFNPAPKDKNTGGSGGSGRFWKASQRNYMPPGAGRSQKVLSDDPKKKKPIRRLNDVPRRFKNTSPRRQNDDEGDYDTEGGEYEGADQGQGQQGGSGPKKSMPMMIIRGFDVLSMDVPVMGQKACKPPPQQEPQPEEPETEPPEEPTEEETEPPTEEETTCATTPPPEPVTEACKLEDDVKVGDVGFANEPVQLENKPVQLENKPAQFENKPAQFENKPSQFENKPSQFENKPARFETKPVQLENKPSQFESKPAQFENRQASFENKQADDNWGDWSMCSKSCGVGLQSRSRLMPTGLADRDTEVRTCQLSECPEGKPRDASQVGLPQYGYGDGSKT